MKCEKCGYTSDTDFKFCKNCGAPAVEEALLTCPTPNILSFIKDDLFFVVCILLAAGVGCILISGGFNALTLLITIFAWLTYVGGRKNIIEHKHIKVISGSVYAIYVIENILGVLVILCGIVYSLMMLGLPLLSGLNIEEFITDELGPMIMVSGAVLTLISAIAMFLGAILIALGIIMLIVNIAGRKKLHQLIRSIYKSAEAGEENLVGVNKAQPWIIIFAVLLILSAVSYITNGNIFGFLSESAFAAALIICNILVSKHLCDK